MLEVLGQEAGQGVPVVWPQLVGFAKPINHNNADLGSVDLTLASEVREWLENAFDKGGGGVGVAGGEEEQRLDGRLSLDQLEVGGKLGSLGHLGGNGVDKLWDKTCGRVVRLAEVVGDEVGCKPGEVAGALPLVLDPPALAKATCLDQRENDSSLASAWAYDTV